MARLLANGRPQHIPSQTDTVVRFVQEHVAVFLRLCELVKKGATRLLVVMVPLGYRVWASLMYSLMRSQEL